MKIQITPRVTDDAPTDAISIAAGKLKSPSAPISVTTSGVGNFVHGFYRAKLLTYRDDFTVSSVSGNRVTVNEDTTSYDLRADGFGDGATVRAYRVSGGALVKAAETTLTKYHARKWNKISKDYVSAGTSVYRYRFAGWNRPNFAQWFGVCAMDASGNLGPIVYATFTSGALTTTQPAAPTNTLATDVTPGSIGGAGPVAPTQVAATSEDDGWIAAISWTDTPGAHGHVIFRCDYDPTDLLTDTFDLADASGIEVGDMLVVDKEFPPLASRDLERAATMTSRTWASSEFKGYNSESVGQADYVSTFTINTDTNEGKYIRHVWDGVTGKAGLGVATHSGTAQTWYHVLEAGQEYALQIRARGTGTLRLRVYGGLDPQAATMAETTAALASEWATYSLTFTPSSTYTGTQARNIEAILVGAGTLDVVWMAMSQTHTPLGEATALDISRADGVKLVRNHEHIKSRPWSHSFADLVSGTKPPLGLWLKFCADIGASPWFQHEWIWDEDDWSGFAEYLLAPYDPQVDTPETKPWAAKRYAFLGWEAPVIDQFPEVWIEVGNENWNTLSEFYTLPNISGQSGGTVNGLWLDYVAGLIEASPYWQSAHAAKVKYYAGGWRTQTSSGWTAATAAATTKAHYIGGADYNGGWDSGLSAALDPTDPTAWLLTLGNSVVPTGGKTRYQASAQLKALCDAESVGRDYPLVPAIYEAGPGYVLNGLNGASVTKEQAAAQGLIMRSVGAATATLDAWLVNAAGGVFVNNFFVFKDSGVEWSSHSPAVNGGAPNPPWMWTQWLNQAFPNGFEISTPVSAIAPAEDFDTGLSGVVTLGANPIGVFRLESGGKIAIAVLNRSPVNAYTVTVKVTGTEGKALSLVAMNGVGATVTIPTGDDPLTPRSITLADGYQATNVTDETANNVTITTTPQPYSDKIEATVPAGLARIWVWE